MHSWHGYIIFCSLWKLDKQIACIFRCDICNQGYIYEGSLKSHILQHKEEKDGKKKCPFCEQTFRRTSRNSLWRHKIVAHRRANFQCPKCNHRVTFAKDLKGHMLEEGHISNPNIKCPWCCGIVDFMDIEEHFNECVQKPFSLILQMRKSKLKCPKGAGTKYHKKTYQSWGQFVCPKCGENTEYVQNLLQHMVDEKHEAQVTCPECTNLVEMETLEEHYKACVSTKTSLKESNQSSRNQIQNKGNEENLEDPKLYR